MSRIYCDYFGARHLIGDDYTAILLLLSTVYDDFPTVALRFILIGLDISYRHSKPLTYKSRQD